MRCKIEFIVNSDPWYFFLFTVFKSFISTCPTLTSWPATLLIKRVWHRCFPVNFAKFLRTPFPKNTWWLLLNIQWIAFHENSTSNIVSLNFTWKWKVEYIVKHISCFSKILHHIKNIKRPTCTVSQSCGFVPKLQNKERKVPSINQVCTRTTNHRENGTYCF